MTIPPPKKIQKQVYQEAKSQCSFCGESKIDCLQIHHINGHEQELSNLILVCANCHSKITYGEITIKEVRKKKMEIRSSNLMNKENLKEHDIDYSNYTYNVGGNINSSVITGPVHGNITIKTTGKRAPKVPLPAGSIGANLSMRNYTAYLIQRLNDFRTAGVSYGDMSKKDYNYAILPSQIRRKFKIPTNYIPESRFDELVEYLCEKIDLTIQGKRNKKNGIKNYESFEEFDK